MKLGLIYSVISFILLLIGACGLAAVIEAVGLTPNPEGIGRILMFVFLFLVGPFAFIRGFRQQEKEDKERQQAKPENLRPLNLSGLKETLSAIEKDKPKL